jgi:hypothetical protein
MHAVWWRDGALPFHRTCGYGTQIMLWEPDGEVRSLTHTLPHNLHPSSPATGQQIVLGSDRDGNYELYQIYP